MAARYALRKSASDKFYFNLQAANNEVILTSEMYESKQGAKTGIASCQTNSKLDSRYDRKTSASGQPYFVLTAANNQVVGRSEMYSSTQARDNGIAACKKVGPTAPTVDLT